MSIVTGKLLKNFIGGQWGEAKTQRYEEAPNPATGEILAVVPFSIVLYFIKKFPSKKTQTFPTPNLKPII